MSDIEKDLAEFQEKSARVRTITITMSWWEQATIVASLKGFRQIMAMEGLDDTTRAKNIKDIDEAISTLENARVS
jgi:hypothetical protein